MVQIAKFPVGVAVSGTAIVPVMPYRNPLAMVDWLCGAYGFQKRGIAKGKNAEFEHAELAFGDSMFMVVAAQNPTFDRLLVHPDQVGGVETQACYLVVPDIDAHYARAAASGAEIIYGIRAKESGGRGYASRDPEGHVWLFGTYNPCEDRQPHDDRRRRKLRLGVPALAGGLLVLMVSIGAAVWTFTDMLAALEADVVRFAAQQRDARQGAERSAKTLVDEIGQVRTAKESAERNVAGLLTQLSEARAATELVARSEKEARTLLVNETRAKDGLARAAKQALDQLAQERITREAAERAAKDATDQLSRVQFDKAMAERASKEAAEKYDLERKSRALAERSLLDANAEVARERSARAAAELTATELRNQLAALGTAPQGILALRGELASERVARERFERVAKDAQLQLAQERHSRDATERALKQAQERLAVSSCWACPGGEPCARPN